MRFQLVARCCSRWTTRFVVGIGSGLGLVISPLYLSEIAPSKISGNVGVLTQLGIVLGIFLTQLIGLIFATPSGWRLVFLYSFALGVVQWLASSLMVNPPRRLSSKEEIYSVERRIWGLTQHDTPRKFRFLFDLFTNIGQQRVMRLSLSLKHQKWPLQMRALVKRV